MSNDSSIDELTINLGGGSRGASRRRRRMSGGGGDDDASPVPPPSPVKASMGSKLDGLKKMRTESPKKFYGIILIIIALIIILYMWKKSKGPFEKFSSKSNKKKKKKPGLKILEELNEDEIDQKEEVDGLIESINNQQKTNTQKQPATP